MKPELHPDAARNFNDKTRALLDKVGPMTEALPSELPTHAARPGAPAHVVSEGEIFDFKITGLQDQLGRTTARYFEHEGRRFGLEGDRYKELARLSEGLQRTNALRDVVSTKWVEDRILDWMKEQHTGGGTPELADFIAERCEEDVKEHEVWFPVARLSLDSDLAFGNVVFKTIPKEMLDWYEEDVRRAEEGRSEEEAAQIDLHMSRIRHELQGLAASTITVEAEPQRAAEVGRRESERAVELLRVFDVGATTTPEVTSYCALLGRENIEQIRRLNVEGGRIRGEAYQNVGVPVMNFHLSDEDISRYKETLGFDSASELLTLERRTDFQEKLLDALLLYSRSTREKDLAGRLVYMLVAIETILLRDANEYIEQNIGERMAFVLANTLEERRATVRHLKDAYRLRSKFIHHGQTIDEIETVRTFMLDAWKLFIARSLGTPTHVSSPFPYPYIE
jgi:Apea-like HEPN